MVLRNRILALSLLLATACLPSAQVVRAKSETPVAVAFVMDDDDGGAVLPVPEKLKKQVLDALVARNLQPYELPFDSYAKVFVPVRDTQRRLARLANGEAPLVVLVETKAIYFDQLNGRYRWSVYTRVSAARRGSTAEPLVAALDEPAHLDFEHEREAKAIESVSDDIARKVGALLDEFLGGVEAAPGPSASASTSPVYFVMVDRFANGDPSNDGAIDPADPAAFHGGDLQGVIDHLDELKALGVGTLWLSPVFKMRTEKFFGYGAFHGYWVEDLAQVEPRFGDEALLKRLADEAHRRGMRVVLDVVVNHVAMDSPLVSEHPQWFHRRGPLADWNDPVQLVNNDVHGLPDLAQENPEVYARLLGASAGWIERVGVDGFRLDAVKHVPLEFWSRFNAEVRGHARPGFVQLGEMLDGDPALIARTQHEGGFSAMFDFPLYFALIDVFCRDQSASRLGAALSSDRVYDDPNSLVTLLDNHDLPRVASDCQGDLERVRNALTFQLTARGTPGLTYGTEAALTGAKEPENRGDMVFTRQPLREHISNILRLRREHPALDSGAPRILSAGEDRFVYARLMPSEAAVIAVNRGASPIGIELPRDLSGQVSDGLSGEQLDPKALSVAPGATRVLLVVPARADGFADAAAEAYLQWRSGSRKREVRFEASGAPAAEGALFAVGSGQEMGVWRPERGLGPLPVKAAKSFELPVGSVYELKLVQRGPGAETTWEPGANRTLFVTEGEGPMSIHVTWGAR